MPDVKSRKGPAMNQGLVGLRPYRVSAGASLVGDDYLRLDWNEATVPPPAGVMAAIQEQLGRLHHYPDVEAQALRAKLSEYTGLGIENVRVFNGSDDALRTVVQAFVGAGDGVLVRRPVYTQIDCFLAAQGATVIDWLGKSPFDKAKAAWGAKLGYHRPKMDYTVNPNNPTGVCYELGEIGALCAAFPETLFVVDEAYVEFGGESCAWLVAERGNLVVTRTFSKAFGLAGLRLGYLLGRPDTLATVDLVRNGKDVNALAQVAGIAALENLGDMQAYVEEVRRARAWTADKARGMGLEARETPANFLLLKVNDPEGLVQRLRERKVLVRDRSYLPQMAGYVRVTVGTREQMVHFVSALERCL